MMIPLNSETWFVEMVSNRLAHKFMKPLLQFSTEKNYCTYIGALEEILDWSLEFCDQYCDSTNTSQTGMQGGDCCSKTFSLDDLIISLGEERIKKFHKQSTDHTTYFIEKYSAIEL